MKVKDLIKRLKNMNGNSSIIFYNLKDYNLEEYYLESLFEVEGRCEITTQSLNDIENEEVA
tara:strand:- start:225 stop:407 length:183 start_codon:yes stop_codon:yes gene_type:complete